MRKDEFEGESARQWTVELTDLPTRPPPVLSCPQAASRWLLTLQSNSESTSIWSHADRHTEWWGSSEAVEWVELL